MSARSGILVVYRKELRDMIRDRRTVISMIVVPVLVIPLLMMGLGGAATVLVKKAMAEKPRIMVLGATNAPALHAELAALGTFEIVPVQPNYTNLISNKDIRAVLKIPEDYNDAVAERRPTRFEILVYQGEMKSQFGAQSLRNFLNDRRREIVDERLTAAGLEPELIEPFTIEETNVAPPQKVSGNLIGGILPYIIILMGLTGGMYPAIDLTAGEKERGTIETLLCSPISRVRIVLGKFLMVVTAAMATTLLSLTSLGGSFLIAGAFADRYAALLERFPISLSVGSLLAVLVMMLPVAVLFAAVLMALSVFARSYKEAQSYVTPLIIVVIVPAVMPLLPGVELNAFMSLIPVLNVSLVSKELLSGTVVWSHLIPIFVSSCVYAAAALGVTVWLFQKESVIFRS